MLNKSEEWYRKRFAEAGDDDATAGGLTLDQHHVWLLTEALNKVLRHVGMIRPEVTTSGPELLLAAEEFMKHDRRAQRYLIALQALEDIAGIQSPDPVAPTIAKMTLEKLDGLI